MQTLIKVGDEITNHYGQHLLVNDVQEGQSGILIEANMQDGGQFLGYAPFELEPLPPDVNYSITWRNYKFRGDIRLVCGVKIGVLGITGHTTLAEHEEKWERTIETMRKEEERNDSTMDNG